jgi:hypothetical protein
MDVTPTSASESALELADFLIEHGQFTMNQYGMSDVAEKGVMPLTFVPMRFAKANDDTRKFLMLQTAAFLALFREAMKSRGNGVLADVRVTTLKKHEEKLADVVEILRNRMRQSKTVNDEIAEFFRERIAIEEAYVKSLQKLHRRQPIPGITPLK